jgi:hypothetical protein
VNLRSLAVGRDLVGAFHFEPVAVLECLLVKAHLAQRAGQAGQTADVGPRIQISPVTFLADSLREEAPADLDRSPEMIDSSIGFISIQSDPAEVVVAVCVAPSA